MWLQIPGYKPALDACLNFRIEDGLSGRIALREAHLDFVGDGCRSPANAIGLPKRSDLA
jgi:hypothetical protein